MSTTASALANRIAVARGGRPADVVLRGATVMSVLTGVLVRGRGGRRRTA